MKKTYALYLALILSSASSLADSVLDYHLTTSGEKSSAASYQLLSTEDEGLSPLEMQLTTSRDKNTPSGHTLSSQLDTVPQDLFSLHYQSTDK